MASSDESLTISPTEDDTNQPIAGHLRPNVLPWYGVLIACAACVAPMAALFFNVPGMAAQAGAVTPLVFTIGAVGLLLLTQPITYFARRLPLRRVLPPGLDRDLVVRQAYWPDG